MEASVNQKQPIDTRNTVSVVIIFLNAEKFMTEAIESVFSQTYSNWEILLVDDGSTDKSTEIARNYAHEFPQKIYYFEHPGHENLGMSASRNLGLRNSKGEYLTLLDADDVFLPKKLERQVEILENNSEAAMVYGPSLYWYGWTGKEEDVKKDRVTKLGVVSDRIYRSVDLMRLYLSGGGFIPCTCGLMARKKALIEVGGFEDSFKGLRKL